MNNPVFADASFWIALRDPKDQFHAQSARLARCLLQTRSLFFLTPLVFAEVHAQFSRARRTRAQVIRDCWDNPAVRIEQPTPADQEEAIEILRQQEDKSYSFCDAVSFAVMMRLGIRRVVTFDAHFRQYGKFEIIESDTDV
jgi:predicted nucleic acid-binding protein